MRFFTADTHFGDTRILHSARRPFATIAEHDRHLLACWQAVVGAEDELWFLGDFAPGHDAAAVGALLDVLPGQKYLVTGNNDDEATRTHPGWRGVHDYRELEEDGVLLVLCHYALRTWNRIGKGALDLHGHSHNMLKPLARQYDVGVDAWDYAPVTLAQMRGGRRGWISRQRPHLPLEEPGKPSAPAATREDSC